jgi:hypothetical protein
MEATWQPSLHIARAARAWANHNSHFNKGLEERARFAVTGNQLGSSG